MFDVTSLRFYKALCEKGILNNNQSDLDDVRSILQEKQFECLEKLEVLSDKVQKEEINELLNIIGLQLKEIAKIKAGIASGIIDANAESDYLAVKTNKTEENNEKILRQKTEDKKQPNRVLLGAAIGIGLLLLMFMINGPSRPKHFSNDYYGVTSRQLEDKLLERFQENNVEIIDSTGEVFNERGTLGYAINEDPPVVMMVYTQSPSESYDYDSPVDYCCIVSEISDYSSDYIAKAICEIVGSQDEETVKKLVERNLGESKFTADNDPKGEDHFITEPLDNDWTLGYLRLERTNHDIVVISPYKYSALDIIKDCGFVGD